MAQPAIDNGLQPHNASANPDDATNAKAGGSPTGPRPHCELLYELTGHRRFHWRADNADSSPEAGGWLAGSDPKASQLHASGGGDLAQSVHHVELGEARVAVAVGIATSVDAEHFGGVRLVRVAVRPDEPMIFDYTMDTDLINYVARRRHRRGRTDRPASIPRANESTPDSIL